MSTIFRVTLQQFETYLPTIQANSTAEAWKTLYLDAIDFVETQLVREVDESVWYSLPTTLDMYAGFVGKFCTLKCMRRKIHKDTKIRKANTGIRTSFHSFSIHIHTSNIDVFVSL